MSTKPTTSKGDLRLPLVIEPIVTRRKSAQQKRQLRNKDSSIKRISQFTQLLLSPTKNCTSKSPPTKSKCNLNKNLLTGKATAAKCSKEKSPEKKDVKQSPKKVKTQGRVIRKNQSPKQNIDKLVEYYPNKLKRNFEGKKVILKPKHEMKVVVGTRIGKRKLVLPQKGPGLRSPPPKLQKLHSTKIPKPQLPTARIELSIEDLVHLHNDDSLDDEDWLEILTCPSPVWWEDPPDCGFDDEPMLQLPAITKTQEIQEPARKRCKTEPKKTDIENKVNITNVLSEGNVKVLEMKKSDDKFMSKRSKLENLLGIIRNKVNDCFELDQSKSNKGKSDTASSGQPITGKSDIAIKKTQAIFIDNMPNSPLNDYKSNSPEPKKEKRTSESTEEDPFLNFRDDDLLNDLENIDIPMETDERDKYFDTKSKSFLYNSSNVDKYENCGQEKANIEDFINCNVIIKGSDPIFSVQSSVKEENNETENINVQISKLTTTSIEKEISTSPMSAKSIISTSDENYETSSGKSQDVDTISDTNIKFIDEDDVSSSRSCEVNDKNDKIENTQVTNSNKVKINEISNVKVSNKDKECEQSCTNENVSKSNNIPQNPRKEKDYMTVYKIISNDDDSCKVNKTKNNNSMFSKINELIKASKEYNNFKANLKSSEAAKSKLDSFYKKFKNHQSRHIKKPETINTSDLDSQISKNNEKIQDKIITINEGKEINNDNKNKSETFNENTQNNNENQNCEKKSILVPNSSSAIRYCLKCSCIFDTDECHYCEEKSKVSTEILIPCKNGSKLSNREKQYRS